MKLIIIVIILNILFLIYNFLRYVFIDKKNNEIITDLENNCYELKKQKNELEENLKKKKQNINDNNEDIKKLKENIEQIKNELNNQYKTNETLKTIIETKDNLMIGLEKKRRESAGKIGGLQTENNKLKEQVKDLEKKLKESMTDKYLVHKIRPSKSVPTFKMKMRSNSVESKIIKDIKEK